MLSLLSAPLAVVLGDEPLNPELSFGDISLLTFEAVMQAVIICFAGYVVARTGLLTAAGQKVISQINVDLFTPCLVFTKLASSLSINKLDDILIIPVFYAVSTLIAYCCSRLSSKALRLNAAESDFVTAMSVFGNSNSLPVSLTLSLSYTLPDLLWDQIPDDDADRVASRGILYLLIFQQLGQILRWSWGFNTLLRKRSVEELTEYYDSRNQRVSETTRLLDDDAMYITSSNQEETTPMPDPNQVSEDDPDPKTSELDISGWRAALLRVTSWGPLRSFLDFMNPPLYAMALSIIVAAIPLLQRLFFEPGTFINNTVSQSIKQLGLVSIPLILIVMGSNLSPSKDVPPASKNFRKMVFASLISRMILPSFVLLPIIAACVKYINISILDDPIFLIVAFILTISPPAIQLSQITQLNNIYQKEMASVLFWGYVVLTLPTTIFIVVTSLEVLKWAQ